jgi:hypothetical protein
MTEHHPHDDTDIALQREFDALRAADRARAPDFATMAARARAMADAAPPVIVTSATPIRRWQSSPLAWAVPALAAAGLAAVLLMPRQNADAEFETLVSDWSRTSASIRTPTDELLALPGDQYLRTTPMLSTPAITLPPIDLSLEATPSSRSSRPENPS